MKFIVSSAILLKNLQILNGVINTSNTLPILDNFLFDISKDKLNITASDLETRISTIIDIQCERVGSLALPSKMLLEILKSFPDQPLTMSVSDNNILEINANNGKYSIGFFPGEDYPTISQLKDPDSTTINSEVLLESINRTLFATGNDDLRPVMSGVFFQLTSSNFTFVATDAHKLVKYSRNDLKSENTTEFIMPKKPLQILKGILQNIKYEIGDGIFFKGKFTHHGVNKSNNKNTKRYVISFHYTTEPNHYHKSLCSELSNSTIPQTINKFYPNVLFYWLLTFICLRYFNKFRINIDLVYVVLAAVLGYIYLSFFSDKTPGGIGNKININIGFFVKFLVFILINVVSPSESLFFVYYILLTESLLPSKYLILK